MYLKNKTEVINKRMWCRNVQNLPLKLCTSVSPSLTVNIKHLKKMYYSSLAVLGLCCCMGFSPGAGSREYSSCSAQASQCDSFSCCGAQALGHVGSVVVAAGSIAQAQELWRMGIVALWHVGFSRIRNQTAVSSIGRQTLYNWTTREALKHFILRGRWTLNPNTFSNFSREHLLISLFFIRWGYPCVWLR